MQNKRVTLLYFIDFLYSGISIEKFKQRFESERSSFGRTFIHFSGPHTNKVYVTDHTIRIPIPGEPSLGTLNLIYTNDGQVNLPANKRAGVFRLLQDNQHHLISVTSVTEEEKTLILTDIREGKFDLIATAKQQSSKRLASSRDKTALNDEIQLLRICRTGEFFTYNNKTGNLNKLKDARTKHWNYVFDEQTHFYKKYLIKDDISTRNAPYNRLSVISESQNEAVTTKGTRLPLLEQRTSKNKRYSHTRSWSFTSVSKDTFYKRYLRGEIPLQRSLTDKLHVHRLTRSNILRHEFYQVLMICYTCTVSTDFVTPTDFVTRQQNRPNM